MGAPQRRLLSGKIIEELHNDLVELTIDCARPLSLSNLCHRWMLLSCDSLNRIQDPTPSAGPLRWRLMAVALVSICLRVRQ